MAPWITDFVGTSYRRGGKAKAFQDGGRITKVAADEPRKIVRPLYTAPGQEQKIIDWYTSRGASGDPTKGPTTNVLEMARPLSQFDYINQREDPDVSGTYRRGGKVKAFQTGGRYPGGEQGRAMDEAYAASGNVPYWERPGYAVTPIAPGAEGKALDEAYAARGGTPWWKGKNFQRGGKAKAFATGGEPTPEGPSPAQIQPLHRSNEPSRDLSDVREEYARLGNTVEREKQNQAKLWEDWRGGSGGLASRVLNTTADMVGGALGGTRDRNRSYDMDTSLTRMYDAHKRKLDLELAYPQAFPSNMQKELDPENAPDKYRPDWTAQSYQEGGAATINEPPKPDDLRKDWHRYSTGQMSQEELDKWEERDRMEEGRLNEEKILPRDIDRTPFERSDDPRTLRFQRGGEAGDWTGKRPDYRAGQPYGPLLTPAEMREMDRDKSYTYSPDNPYAPGQQAEPVSGYYGSKDIPRGHQDRGLTSKQIMWMDKRRGEYLPPSGQQETGGFQRGGAIPEGVTRNFDDAKRRLFLSPQEQLMYGYHLHNLWSDDGYTHANGMRTTYYMTPYEENRTWYALPGVAGGRLLSRDDAIAQSKDAGLHNFQGYASEEAMQHRYDQLHQYMEKDTDDWEKHNEAMDKVRRGPLKVGDTEITEGYKRGGKTKARFGMTDPYAEDRFDPGYSETPGPGPEEDDENENRGMGVPPEGWDEDVDPRMPHKVPEGPGNQERDNDEEINLRHPIWQYERPVQKAKRGGKIKLPRGKKPPKVGAKAIRLKLRHMQKGGGVQMADKGDRRRENIGDSGEATYESIGSEPQPGEEMQRPAGDPERIDPKDWNNMSGELRDWLHGGKKGPAPSFKAPGGHKFPYKPGGEPYDRYEIWRRRDVPTMQKGGGVQTAEAGDIRTGRDLGFTGPDDCGGINTCGPVNPKDEYESLGYVDEPPPQGRYANPELMIRDRNSSRPTEPQFWRRRREVPTS